MRFADKLKELREEASLTQAALATASGLSLGIIRDYEQGNREPAFQSLFKLCSALGLSPEVFAECAKGGEKPNGRGK
jgi:transcriptional regulator with XRE-family HTH domain